ncbi:MAG TPA: VCBS repeat-containing protein, partial [Pyrinomonadaceae bacterium]|nr:VCBS repeat-containing protein [Pyrinomonadaceae bacterium]
PVINFPSGPDGLAVGDLNNDGRRDLVIGDYGLANVTVLTGDGAGGFTIGTPVSVGGSVRSVTIADVNADSNADVLTTNDNGTVSVRLGNGLGGLSGTTNVVVGGTPVSLTAGMFDGDANLDIAVSNNSGNSISIRNGDGLGGFSGTTELSPFSVPESIALADIDNDGIHDIVVAESYNYADVVNFGDGSGGFAQTLSVEAGFWPYSLKVGDFNADGRQDLATGNFSSSVTTVRLGTCYTPTPTPTPTPEETPTPTPTPTPEPTPTPTPETGNITVSDNNLTVGGFSTLKDAIDAVNAGTFSGAITMTVNADTTETAMASLTYSGNGSANYTSISISPAIGGPRFIIGTLPGEAILELNGADNVTIDGINAGGTSLTFANAQNTAFGSTNTLRLLNGASNNLIRNVDILGSHPGSTGTVNIGGDTVSGNGNDDNTIEFCNIGPYGGNLPHTGIRSSSTTGASNSGNVINNNNIFDFTGNGMFIFSAKFWTISNNRLFQTAPITGSQTVMQIDDSNITTGSEGITVTGNVIGYASAAGTGTYTVNNAATFRAMHVQLWSAGSPSTVSDNTITAISVTNAAAGSQFDGIRIPQGPVTVSGNTIGSTTATDAITVSSSTTVAVESFGIYHIGLGAFTANNNQIGGLTFDNANTGGLIFRGIAALNVRTGPFTASGNTIGGTVANSIRTQGFNNVGTPSQVIGISVGGWPSTISGNTIQNLTSRDGIGTAAQASVIGIVTTDATVNHLIQTNTIRDLTNTADFGSFSSVVTGIQFTGSTASSVERNHISRLFNYKSGTSTEANGIRIAGGTTVFRNNMIAIGDNILTAIGSGSTTGGINGINEPLGTNTFYHNSVSITGLPTSGSGPSYALNSSVTTNTRSYRNNIFSNGRSNNGSTGKNYAIRVGGTGVNPAGLTSDNNLFYSTGSGAFFGYFNSIDRADLSAWQTATGKDAASIVGDPLFNNALL